jgi:GntR family transcriptional regulator of arabinose operon
MLYTLYIIKISHEQEIQIMKTDKKRVPLYKQIQEYILNEIAKNNWMANYKLPSEMEIAELFNVSRLTVSNALKDLIEKGLIYRIQGKGTFVSPNQSGEPVKYRAEPKRSDKRLIACLMPLALDSRALKLINGIEEELAVHGYRLLFCKTHDKKEMETRVIQEILQLDIAGIIIYPVEGESYSEELLRLTLNHFPYVVIDRYLQGLECNYVCSDNWQGARDATTYLIEQGHRNIGFAATYCKGTSSIEDRLTGYEDAFALYNIPIEHRLRKTRLSREKANQILINGECDDELKKELQEFLQQNPDMTAILAASAAVGLSVIQAAGEIGIRVPDDLSVVLFDDYELSNFSKVPPTCVIQQDHLIGREAAKLIVSIVDNPVQEVRKIKIPTKLVVRHSTAPARQVQRIESP